MQRISYDGRVIKTNWSKWCVIPPRKVTSAVTMQGIPRSSAKAVVRERGRGATENFIILLPLTDHLSAEAASSCPCVIVTHLYSEN